MKQVRKPIGDPNRRAKAKKASNIGSEGATVVDLFCGVGGLSHGFYLEGMKVVAGIDIDPACEYAYQANNGAKFVCQDVSSVTSAELAALWGQGAKVLVGCAPCQPFSSYAQRWENPDWQLLENFAQLIVDSKPDVVSMENVPRLLDFQNGAVFERFVGKIRRAGYKVTTTIASDARQEQVRDRAKSDR
jgi:DNA (cytosine-5)-methyltransferase 1